MAIKRTPPPNRRRSRPYGKRNNFTRNSSDGNVNSFRPKGSVPKILEKYLNLAQDATSNGDRIRAEGFYQHAEHYQRIMNSNSYKENSIKKDLNNNINQTDSDETKKDAAFKDQNKPSRTERANMANNNRINVEKEIIEKNVTNDGVEALRAFNGSLKKDEIKG